MLKIMAAELRIIVVTLGERVVERIRNRNITINDDLKKYLQQLSLCFADPIRHEKDIFKVQDEIINNFKVFT